MFCSAAPAGVWRALAAFRRASAANVTITFALAIVPVLGSVGAAIDFGHANAVRTAMQAAADSTALMLSRDAHTLNAAELQAKADAYFKAMYGRSDGPAMQVAATYSNAGGSQLVVRATGRVDTEFMRIMGFPQLPVGAESEVKWGNTRLRVALVLDTTGSMDADGKMPALKKAAKDLLGQLESAAVENGDVYVSLIPFSKNVNLGSGHHNANWIDWTDWEAEPQTARDWINGNASTWEQVGPGSNCPFTNTTHGFVCASGPTTTSTTSRVPSSGAYSGYICPATDSGRRNATRIGIMYNGCYNSVERTRTVASGSNASCGSRDNCACSGSGPKRVCTQTYYQHDWVINARSTWNGCVTDRGTSGGPSQDYDRLVTAPGAGAASRFPSEQNLYCSPPAMALNHHWASMRQAIDNLYPLGATNQPIGLVWGWQSLVGGGPFPAPPPKDDRYTYTEVIVLMSDGLNTLNRWSGNGSATSTAVDRRMVDTNGTGTCANIKAAGITVYSIHFNTEGDPMSTLLRNCASTQDKFWMITSAGELGAVFNQIGSQLSQLRVSK